MAFGESEMDFMTLYKQSSLDTSLHEVQMSIDNVI